MTLWHTDLLLQRYGWPYWWQCAKEVHNLYGPTFSQFSINACFTYFQAATYGCGCWASNGTSNLPSVATCTSGCGEYLVRTMLAREAALEVQKNSCSVTGLHKVMKTKFMGEASKHRLLITGFHTELFTHISTLDPSSHWYLSVHRGKCWDRFWHLFPSYFSQMSNLWPQFNQHHHHHHIYIAAQSGTKYLHY